MELLGSTQRKTTKNKNGENVPHLEITEVVSIQCNIVNDNYHQNSRVLYTFIYFTKIFYIFKNSWLKIFIYWSMVYSSKF